MNARAEYRRRRSPALAGLFDIIASIKVTPS